MLDRSSCHMCYAPLPSYEIEMLPDPELLPIVFSEPIIEPIVEMVAEPVAEPVAELVDEPIDQPVITADVLEVEDPIHDHFIDTEPETAIDEPPTPPEVTDPPEPSQPDSLPSDDLIQIAPDDDDPLDEIVIDDKPVEPEPVPITPSEPTLNELLPEFLRSDAVKRNRGKRNKSRARLRALLHRTTGWILVLFILALSYAAWLHKPMFASEQQAATATAARLALAINERDYAEIYRSTIWKDHYKQAFRSSLDIDRFCQNRNYFQSFKLTHLAELWQMKHTVVVSGKLIGRNSIGYTFIDTSSKQRKFQFTLTRTPSRRWMWDIAYDHRLSPSDIPLLNHIMVQSRLQKPK